MTDNPTLDTLDSEISRCIDCGDWRWRSSYLPCQQCGAPSYAIRIFTSAGCTDVWDVA